MRMSWSSDHRGRKRPEFRRERARRRVLGALRLLAHQCSGLFLLGSFGELLCVICVSGPICRCDTTNRIKCSCSAAWRFTEGDRVRYRYAHLSPRGNSVLLGTKKDELPGVNLALVLDHFEDLFALEFLRSVLQAVCQNCYDHLAWPFRFRCLIEPFADRVDRATDCIQ